MSTSKLSLVLAAALVFSGGVALADPQEHGGGGGEHGGGGESHGGGPQGGDHGGPQGHGSPGPAHGEPHEGPKGYQRVTEPHGWNERPKEVDRGSYQHNFQASRSFHVGPYHRPHGWVTHHWGYGQILPRAYWGSQYILADYWLFALEVPPAGYEWVRDDTDALLVNTQTGEILQVEYGAFG